MNIEIKQQAKKACLEKLQRTIAVCRKQVQELKTDLANETKSSAGDKYETGRAMLQIELEKLGKQLTELDLLEDTLHGIATSQQHQRVQVGSFVKTTQQNYFISVSLGEIKLPEFSFYAISKQTPIAEVLLGKTTGEQVQFRGQTFVLMDVS